jgi:hypothetical protein
MDLLDLTDPGNLSDIGEREKARMAALALLTANIELILKGFEPLLTKGLSPESYVAVVVSGDLQSQAYAQAEFPDVAMAPGHTAIFLILHVDFLAGYVSDIMTKLPDGAELDLTSRSGTILTWVISRGLSYYPRLSFLTQRGTPTA